MDKVLEGCFQLLSLFYLTIGRNDEAPATYALTSTIKRLLDHLCEANLYSSKDLESIKATLEQLNTNITRSGNSDTPGPQHSPYLLELLSKRVERCSATLSKLQKRLNTLDESSLPTYEKMISILRSISYANTRSKVSVYGPGSMYGALRLTRHNSSPPPKSRSCRSNCMRLVKRTMEVNSASQAQSRQELRPCKKFTTSALAGPRLCWNGTYPMLMTTSLPTNEGYRKGDVPEPFRETYRTLVGIRNELEKLSLTQAWSLRETDLYDFQRKLDKIDESRQNGNFFDDKSRPADLWTQRTMLYLIRRSYSYIYSFILSSEPVSEALLPIYNQLQTLKRCLLEVKDNGGVSSVRELYPYSMKVSPIRKLWLVIKWRLTTGSSPLWTICAWTVNLSSMATFPRDKAVFRNCLLSVST